MTEPYRSGFGLPQDVLFDVDRSRRLLEHRWTFVATRGDVANPGDMFAVDLFSESYVLVHGVDGVIRGFENRCLHQSARLSASPTNRCGARLVCPNHQWSYDPTSGALRGATGMPRSFFDEPPDGFAGLQPIAVAERGGLLFVRLGTDTDESDLDVMQGVLAPYTDPFHLDTGGYKLALHEREVVDANWLLVMINNRECVHCRANHPGLCDLFDPSSFNGGTSSAYEALFAAAVERWEAAGLAWREQAFTAHDATRVARYPMQDGYASTTFDGRPACAKPIGPWDHHDASTLSVWLNPNAWIHYTSDHIATNWVLPLGPDSCALHTSYLVHEDAEEGIDYDLDHLAEVWRVTNGEDVELCRSMTAGARSRHYLPGPFGENERWCTQLCDWVMANSD